MSLPTSSLLKISGRSPTEASSLAPRVDLFRKSLRHRKHARRQHCCPRDRCREASCAAGEDARTCVVFRDVAGDPMQRD
jgi:hypothetical protein